MEDYAAEHYTTQSSPSEPVLLQDAQDTRLYCYLFGLGTYKQILRSNEEETKSTTNHATRCPTYTFPQHPNNFQDTKFQNIQDHPD
jgi:hypothetical protein